MARYATPVSDDKQNQVIFVDLPICHSLQEPTVILSGKQLTAGHSATSVLHKQLAGQMYLFQNVVVEGGAGKSH